MAEVISSRGSSRKERGSSQPASQAIERFAHHNKTKAIEAAQWAVRPSSAITGLGERAGATASQQQTGVLRGHNVQRPRTAAAGHGRDIWPQDMQQKPDRFCVGCRGGHEREHEHNPQWQPYTPLQRFDNLHMLETNFQRAFRQNELPLVLTGGKQAVKWTGVTADGKALKPQTLTEQQYKQLLPLAFEGLREGHEPYRFVATCAALELLALASNKTTAATARNRLTGTHQPKPVQAEWLLEVLPDIVLAIKAGLNTMQPSLAANVLLVLQRLLDTNSSVGPALVPHYKQLLPVMALLTRHSRRDRSGASRRLILPPPHCLPPVGSFTGDGLPPAGSPTCCHVCGAAFVSPATGSAQQQQQLDHHLQEQEEVCGKPLPPRCESPRFRGEIPEVHARTVGCALTPRRATMLAVVEETLQRMVEAGGHQGLAVVKRHMPTFDYCNPQD